MRRLSSPVSFPSPRSQPLAGHLGRWGTEPLALLDEGAALGPVFSIRLWRRAVIGYRPDWNRLVLGDLDTFRSKGSLSGLSPYLAGGVVQADPPIHRPRRAALNPSFHRRAMAELEPALHAVVDANLPTGQFDAVEWSSTITRELLATAFFGGDFPRALLADFLRPLDTRPPGPFLRRPVLFRRMNAALTTALADAKPGTLARAFADLTGAADYTASDITEELRVALSAAYDTTAHTMAFLLWHLATNPSWGRPESIANAVSETLRLYPAGWLGSRRAARDVDVDGTVIKAGTLVLYSPYLTHRDPTLWTAPLTFRPERFTEPLPAWGYIPFAAGERTCLGANLAQLILRLVGTAAAEGLRRADEIQLADATKNADATQLAEPTDPGGPTHHRADASLRVGPEALADPPLRAGLTLGPAAALLLRR